MNTIRGILFYNERTGTVSPYKQRDIRDESDDYSDIMPFWMRSWSVLTMFGIRNRPSNDARNGGKRGKVYAKA